MNIRCAQSGNEIIASLFDRYPELRTCEEDIRSARNLITATFNSSFKILVCGNGGSAADSEHIVGELMKSFRFKRPVKEEFKNSYKRVNEEEPPEWLEGALPAISLVSQSALSTAFSNDESSIGIFAQQVYGYGNEGDALIAISTSGNSANVVEAAKVARAIGMNVISLTGINWSKLASLSNICIQVPRSEVFQVQEMHLPVYHCLCAAAEADIFGE